MINKLETANKIEIFREIAVDDKNKIDQVVLDHITDSAYDDFIKFCDRVYEEKDSIKSASYLIDSDGSIKFNVTYK